MKRSKLVWLLRLTDAVVDDVLVDDASMTCWLRHSSICRFKSTSLSLVFHEPHTGQVKVASASGPLPAWLPAWLPHWLPAALPAANFLFFDGHSNKRFKVSCCCWWWCSSGVNCDIRTPRRRRVNTWCFRFAPSASLVRIFTAVFSMTAASAVLSFNWLTRVFTSNPSVLYLSVTDRPTTLWRKRSWARSPLNWHTILFNSSSWLVARNVVSQLTDFRSLRSPPPPLYQKKKKFFFYF